LGFFNTGTGKSDFQILDSGVYDDPGAFLYRAQAVEKHFFYFLLIHK